jgi:hypothetical protein
MVKRSARIEARDHRQQMKLMKLNNLPPTREFRVRLQYLMALQIQDVLCFAAEEELPFGSLAILRTGIETLALGLWWGRCATQEEAQGTSVPVIPGSLEAIVAVLPKEEQGYFAFLDTSVAEDLESDVQRVLLRDVLNPISHGDALTAANRIGSAAHHPDGAVLWERKALEYFRKLVHFFEMTVGIECLGS